MPDASKSLHSARCARRVAVHRTKTEEKTKGGIFTQIASGSAGLGSGVRWAQGALGVLACCSQPLSATAVFSNGSPSADVAIPVPGVSDRGEDPPVVAIDVGGRFLCSGALVAPDLVLTARRCVAAGAVPPALGGIPGQPPASSAGCFGVGTSAGSPFAAQSLRILVGDDIATSEEVARGADVIVPSGESGCNADVAIVVLDAPVDGVQPIAVRPTGAAKGDHLRTVGYASLPGAASARKLVRDHLLVRDTSPAALFITQACPFAIGGPAIDESTGTMVGVSSRPGSLDCAATGAGDVFTRTDAFLGFVGNALARSAAGAGVVARSSKTKKGAVDMGASCASGSDCAAGVCVTERDRQYCSRDCAALDRCPIHFRCQKSESTGGLVCIEN